MYAEELQLEKNYNDAVLLSTRTYEIKLKVGTEPTEMYPLVSFVDTEAVSKVIDGAFIELQENNCIKCQDTPEL